MKYCGSIDVIFYSSDDMYVVPCTTFPDPVFSFDIALCKPNPQDSLDGNIAVQLSSLFPSKPDDEHCY